MIISTQCRSAKQLAALLPIIIWASSAILNADDSTNATTAASASLLTWPDGQALPTFASPAPTLDAIDVQTLTVDERIMFSALQGIVNARQPRIYLMDSRAEEGPDTWAKTTTIDFTSRNRFTRDTKYELISKYIDETNGIVLYDPTRSDHYRNLATTVAGLKRALPVTPDLLASLRQTGLQFNVVADLTTLQHSTAVDIYQHLYDTYWSQCDKRLLTSIKPDRRRGNHHQIRDMATACGAAVVWLDCRMPAERELMRKFLADMQAGKAIILGWYTSERSGITTASEFGIGTIPADHYNSSTMFAGTDHRIAIPPVPKKPPLENNIYVAVFISDGDNIQYVQRAMRRIWDRVAESRGRVPLNWTIAPGLVDIGPGILNYYYQNATARDCFVAGPSGMGYLMPINTLAEL
ncbi:MAG: hypothetical protein KDB23_20620, partial [Planctomycetales bacterium]|nr:hypothetical protein [Planctomycetales bacterium]